VPGSVSRAFLAPLTNDVRAARGLGLGLSRSRRGFSARFGRATWPACWLTPCDTATHADPRHHEARADAHAAGRSHHASAAARGRLKAVSDLALTVHRRVVLASSGRVTDESVFCPARARTVATSTCRRCAHVHAVTRELVLCAPPGVDPPAGPGAPAASLASSHVALVRDDVPGGVILDLAERTAPPLVVIDERDRFLGFVSLGLRALPQWPWVRFGQGVARDFTKGRALFVLETAPVISALRLMARRGARWLALVDATGAAQGVISDVAALAALGGGTPAASTQAPRDAFW
jgi:CBS domain-containing protein